jgi:hypothetical protein
LAGRSLVAVTGDSININNVYRDADIVWNSRALPIPLVFFAHQNPVAWDVEVKEEPKSSDSSFILPPSSLTLLPPNGTDDVLVFRDLVRLLAESAYPSDRRTSPQLLANADELAARLRATEPPFFDSSGDRRGGRGEYIVVLRPQFARGAPVLTEAVLEIWTRDDPANGISAARPNWKQIQKLVIEHGQRAAY